MSACASQLRRIHQQKGEMHPDECQPAHTLATSIHLPFAPAAAGITSTARFSETARRQFQLVAQ